MLPIKALTRPTLFVLLIIAGIVWQTPARSAGPAAPDPTPGPATSQPGQRSSNSLIARITLRGTEDLRDLAGWLDIWEVQPGAVLAMLSPQTYDRLISAGYQVAIDATRTDQANQALQPLPGQTSGIPGYPCYRTVEETNQDLFTLASENPNLARWVDIGDSWEKLTDGGLPGYDLNVLILSNQGIPGPKPVFFVMAAIHARELVTAETATRFAEYLVNRYGIDPRVTALLDFYEIHILPVSNPDGRKLAEAGYFWRKNTDNNDGCQDPNAWGTDLNRNHTYRWGSASPWPCNETYQGPAAGSEPETQVLQNYMLSIFADQKGPLDGDPAPANTTGAMLTLHSYGRLVLWPWGWTEQTAPNDTQLATLGRKLAFFNNYTAAQSINLYPTYGTSDDWAYAELGIAAYTIEMGTYFFQDCTSFENTIYPDNLRMLLYAVQSARRPYQDPSGPEAVSVQVNPPAVLTGGSASLTALADDARYKGGSGEAVQAIAAARYSLDATSWISPTATLPMSASDGAFDASQETISATVSTAGLGPGRHLILVEGQDASGNWGVPGAGYLCVSDHAFSPMLSGEPTTREANPGETVRYHLRVENLGTSADTYDLNLSGATWPTMMSGNPGSLDPCSAAAISVEVAIPETAFGGSSSVATLTVTSQADPSRSFSLDLTTATILDYRIDLDPLQSTLFAEPGETITHTIQITNSGNYTATYAVTLSDNLWPTDPLPASLSIAPGDALGLLLPVHIPADTILGTSDHARLRLQSLDFSEKQSTILLTTNAWWRYYFPFGAMDRSIVP